MRLIYFFSLIQLLFSVYSASAQTPSASFAKWKNNAKGVYTIVHDDYGSFYFDGIQHYADTIAHNRGVVFTFGAITSSCEEEDWKNAKVLIAHGHEIINHTHTHSCAHPAANCPGLLWDSYSVELDQSTDLIKNKTNVYPRFFIWPYDIIDDASKIYLKNSLDYYGARGGVHSEHVDISQLTSHSIADFFSVNFSIYGPSTNVRELDSLIDLSIKHGKWGMREFHGVEDASYSSVSAANYRSHCDYIKSKVNEGVLWNANATEVITYLMQTRAFVPTLTFTPEYSRIDVTWNSPSLDVSDLRTPVTLNIDLEGLAGYSYAYQNGIALPLVNHGDSVSVNCYPHKGAIQLYNYNPADLISGVEFINYATIVRTGTQDLVYELNTDSADEYLWEYSGTGVSTEFNSTKATIDFGSNASNGILSVKLRKDNQISFPLSLNIDVINVNDVTLTCGETQAAFSITNQGSNKYRWFKDRIGGEKLSFSTSYTASVAGADTFYVALPEDTMTIMTTPGITPAFSGTTALNNSAKMITVHSTMVLKSISVWVRHSWNASSLNVKIYKADGKTEVFSKVYNYLPIQPIQEYNELPVNTTLVPGVYYISFENPVVDFALYSDPDDTSERELEGVITIHAGGYKSYDYNWMCNCFMVNTSATYTSTQVPKIGIVAEVPIDPPYSSRVAVIVTGGTPSVPEAITGGEFNVCEGSAKTYQVPSQSGITYWWYYTGTNVQLTSSANEVQLSFSAGATSGRLYVKAQNACGISDSSFADITIENTVPSVPPSISGLNSDICPGSTLSFNFAQESDVNYSWFFTGGEINTLSSGSATDITFSAESTSGRLYVKAINSCGSSESSFIDLLVRALPLPPQTISGPSTVNSDPEELPYTYEHLAGLTYTWEYTGANVQVAPEEGIIYLTFATNSTSGILKGVSSDGYCESEEAAFPINVLPNQSPVVTILSPVNNLDAFYGLNPILIELQVVNEQNQSYTIHYDIVNVSGTVVEQGIISSFPHQVYFNPTSFGLYHLSFAVVDEENALTSASRYFYVAKETGVNDKFSSEFIISPNPFKDLIYLNSLTGQLTVKEVELKDLNGVELIKATDVTGKGISFVRTDELPIGIYVLTILTEEGLYSVKLVKTEK